MIFADLDFGAAGGDLGSGAGGGVVLNHKSVRPETDIVLFEDGAFK